ncbi:MAG: DUF2730 family protein [Thermodesulfobacteriota bacterium]
MDYEKYRFFLDLSVLLANICLWIWVYWANRQKASQEEIKGLRDMIEAFQKTQADKCGKHHSRTTTLEVQLQSAPTHKDLGEIHEKINAVHGSMEKMTGQMQGMGATVNLIHEYLLNQEKNK